MHPMLLPEPDPHSIPILFVTEPSWGMVRDGLDPLARAFADAAGFKPKAGRHLLLPGPDGALAAVLFGLHADDDPYRNPFQAGMLADVLPTGAYHFGNAPANPRLTALAMLLGSYRFTRYRPGDDKAIRLAVPDGVDGEALSQAANAVTLARDLINTPANDMGTADLEAAARGVAAQHGAAISSIVGDELLAQNFPLIHAVGRAGPQPPRLIDMTWGDPGAPKVTLVGKGVCFDTGGLDIKPDSAMLNMKKDMGGAACQLALAHMVMARGLNVRLRVLIPAVENSISATSFRPRDVYPSRHGLTVEIGNTDAEGRLILADALALAQEEAPDLIIDMATLTGAARVALGPDVPPFFTDDETLASDLMRHAAVENDPLWRLPLWRGYDAMLDSKVASLNNVSSGGYAGSITAALFMRRFVADAKAWLHVDIFGWTLAAKPGRPEGGECQAARAIFALLCERYG